LVLALGAVTSLAGGMALTWRLMKSETEAFVQQSIGDSAGILAAHATTHAEQLARQVRMLGEGELRAFLSAKEREATASAAPAPAASSAPAPVTGPASMETDPEILDVALWTQASSDGPPVRVHLAMNVAYISPAPGLADKVRAAEESERALVAPAFGGQTVIQGHTGIDPKGLITLAVPLGTGNVQEVAVAHLRPERLQRAFRLESIVRAGLLDSTGMVLAHSDPRLVFSTLPAGPLVKALREGGTASGQLHYVDETGTALLGGYRRLRMGPLGVVASIPESEARSGLVLLRDQAVVSMALAFVICFGAGFGIVGRRGAPLIPAKPVEQGTGRTTTSAVQAAAAEAEAASIDGTAETRTAARGPVTAVHGSLRGLSGLIEASTPEAVLDAVNDFLTLVAHRAREHGGRFERSEGAAFYAFWTGKEPPAIEALRALRFALDVRRDLAVLNEARKVDGHKPLLAGMGVYSGQAVLGRMGTADAMFFGVAGTPLTCARALDELAPSMGVDLLAAQETWQLCETHLLGEALGEVRLTPDTGLTTYYALAGYRDEAGAEQRVETPYSRTEVPTSAVAPAAIVKREGPKRWLVNNGSQIVGPYTVEQISACLYAQEMDFDSECWAEGTGETSKLAESGIFSGSGESGAGLWVYDGKTIHGPLSQGFLGTALSHGAISEQAMICEGSTVGGWKPLAEWRKAHPELDAVAPPAAPTGETAPAGPTKRAA
jgi:class 3 adenylate cyclase